PFTRREVLQAVETRLQRQSAQQQTERTQVQTLQQEIESLRTSLSEEQKALFQSIRTRLKETIARLNIANSILKTLPPSEQRERSISLLHNVCAAEVKLLMQIPNFDPAFDDLW
ncbi:MAG: response regulator, partial [Leptolyngbya sp. SIO4C1]|nr:response regulator [Leptolyngbya sp. SIO4C1]